MDYLGEKCPICNKVFTEDDDIVVCPDCGTPHHRECYFANGKCAHEEYHFIGRKWEKKSAEKPKYKICPVCRFPNGSNDMSCQRCGTDLRSVGAASEQEHMRNESSGEQWKDPFAAADNEELIDPIKYLGYDPDDRIGDATVREASDFVGPNTIYYLPKFKRLSEDGVRPSFNLLGFIFPSLYFANRRMWLWAAITVAIGALLEFPSDLMVILNDAPSDLPAEMLSFLSNHARKIELLADISVALNISARALCCFFSNWLYYRFTMRSIKKIKSQHRPASHIKQAGGIRPLNALLIMLIKYGAGLMLLAALFFCVEFAFTFNEVYNV